MTSSPHFNTDTDAEDWWVERNEYFSKSICRPAAPGPAGGPSAYVQGFNSNNVIAPTSLPGHEQLLHAASLNAILWRLSSREYATAVLKIRFRDLTGMTLPERLPGWLWNGLEFRDAVNNIADEITSQGADVVKKVAGLLVDGLGDNQPPWWACFAQEVHPYVIQKDWSELAKGLGLGHLNEEDRLLVWRYQVKDVGTLYRPTVVEANDSPYHFPSPPSSAYGITMPLETQNGRAFREVIHAPLRGQGAISACTGELGSLDISPFIDHNQLVSLRESHSSQLKLQFKSRQDEVWLNRFEALL